MINVEMIKMERFNRVRWNICAYMNGLDFRRKKITWIARSQVILDALVDQVNQVTVLTDQNRYKQVALKIEQNFVNK